MIDIFIEELEDNNLTAFFIQLGCVYNCTYNTLDTLCDNIVSLYTELNKTEDGEVKYQYLPITIYNRLYKSNSKFMFTRTVDENTSYTVKKICS